MCLHSVPEMDSGNEIPAQRSRKTSSQEKTYENAWSGRRHRDLLTPSQSVQLECAAVEFLIPVYSATDCTRIHNSLQYFFSFWSVSVSLHMVCLRHLGPEFCSIFTVVTTSSGSPPPPLPLFASFSPLCACSHSWTVIRRRNYLQGNQRNDGWTHDNIFFDNSCALG